MSRVSELRRHSSAKTSSGNNEEKLVPHYLASTRSCHDFCKYGKQLALEPKKTSLIPRIAERTQLYRSLEKNMGEVVAVATPGVKRRESTDSEPTKMSLVKSRESTDSNASDTIKVTKTEPGRPVQPDNEIVVNKMKTLLVKAKQSPLLPKSHFPSTFKTMRQEISKRVEASSVSKSLLASSTSKPSRKRVVGINMHKSLRTASRVKNQPEPGKVESEEHCIETEAEEKTLYVIKIENKDNTFQSDQNANQEIELSCSQSLPSSMFSSQEESEYAASEFKEDFCFANIRKVNEESLETLDLKVEENEKSRKDEIVILVETQVEDSGAKKLKFKRGKVLQNYADSDETDDMTGCEKVVLRHQDMNKGKKGEQVLLNNVIEETTSKLVEIQRSKVKALVGAFETLISLNEKKLEQSTLVCCLGCGSV